MKIDHHEFRMSMGMFELTPDDITQFAKWLLIQDEDPKKFLDKEMDEKRTIYSDFVSHTQTDVVANEEPEVTE